jgi:L-ascorbate metabolism protein UlaG (beta-lactamase superfamily)
MHRIIPFLLVIVLLTACGRRERRNSAVLTGPRQTTVEWLGHGCFRVTSSLNLTVLLDPFDPAALNYPVKVASVPADVIFITHEDISSNYTDLAAGSPQVFRSTMAGGVNRASGILVRGVRTSSENLAAASRLNVAYTWSMDGIRFCDLGAIEDALTASEALNIGSVDVVFLPVGSPPGLTDEERKVTIDRLRPRVIVPMMYSTRYSSKIALGGLGGWLSRQPHVVRLPSNRFTLEKSTLPATTTVYVPAVP